MKNFITNLPLIRLVLFNLLVLSAGSMFAQPTPPGPASGPIISGPNEACPGDPVYLTVDTYGAKDPKTGQAVKVQWYISYDKGATWKAYAASQLSDGSQETQHSCTIREMEGDEIRVQTGLLGSSEMDNNVKTIRKSANCNEKVCKYTSTGDYFNGTDFNPENGFSVNQIEWGKNPKHLESDFVSQKIDLTAQCSNQSGEENWKMSNGEQPYLDRGKGDNYYYVFTPSKCTQPIQLEFNKEMYKNKFFQFTMRFYLDLGNCSSANGLKNAYMNVRGDYGDESYNHLVLNIYDANTNEHLHYEYFNNGGKKGQHSVNLIGPKIVDLFGENKKYLRFELTAYGNFLGTNGKLNLYPQFQQWGSDCAKVAVDYISADFENVCVSPRSDCVGSRINVVGAGLPYGSKLTWQIFEDNEWRNLSSETSEGVSPEVVKNGNVASILLKKPGQNKYRLHATGGEKDVDVEFVLVGVPCENVACPDITGNFKVCLPKDGTLEYYEIQDEDHILNSDKVYYTWDLTGPSGENLNSYITIDPAYQYQEHITINFPATSPISEDLEDVYKLKATAHDGSVSGSVICTDTKDLTVFRNPTMSGLALSLLKGGAEQAEICAATYADNDTVQVSGYDALPDYEKAYTWTWKDASALAKPYASFSLDKSLLCDGTKKNQKIELVISNEYCRDSINKTFSVTTPSEPVIACPEGLSNSKFSLPDDKNMYEFTVPALKTATAACGELQTTITITDSKGTAYGSALKVGSKVSLPAGAYTIKYVITDRCNHSNNCEADFTVVDKTPPVMKCDEIPALSGKLSENGNCTYTFNPVLDAPTITGTDNGVAVTITGEYAGRSRSMTGAFSKTIDLNAEYESGVTYIKWIFKDEADNEAECIQTVTITDDLKPEVTCPTENSLTIGTSTTDCNITWAALKDSIEAKLGTTFPTATKACDYEPAITGPVMYIEGKTAALAGTETFSNGKSYTILYVFTKPADDTKGIIETKDTCKIKVTIKDNTKPVIDCDKWTDKNKSVTLGETNTTCQVNVTLTPPTASLVSDNCTEVDDITFYYGVDHNQYNQYDPNSSYGFGPGVHIVKWVAEDKDGNRSEPCEQTITVTDNRVFTMNCVADGTILEVPSCPGKTFTWDEIKDKISSAGYDISASYHSCGVWNDNDNNEKDVTINPVMTYSEDGTTFSPIGSTTEFAHGKTYTIRYTFTKEGAFIETLTKYCEVKVRLADDGKPTLNCDKIEDKVLHATADCKVTYDIEKPSADAANDGCTSYSDLTFFFKLDGSGAFVKFNNQSEELSVGSHTIVWKVQDKDGNESENSCTQNIIVRDSSTFKANCATADDVIVDNCSDMTWKQVKAALPSGAKATASYKNCGDETIVNVAPAMYYKKTTETEYQPLTDASVFENTVPATTYDIKWVFRTKGTSTYVADLADSCYSKVTVKDNTAPEVHCDATHMQNPVLEAGDNCKKTIDLKDYLPIDVFEDQCTDKADLIFYYRVDGNGDFIKYTDDATVTFEVSNHNNTIEWKVADEAGNVSDVCTQTFTIKDNNMFNFNCPEYTGTHYVIETCDDLSGEAVLDSLAKYNKVATAYFVNCATGKTEKINPRRITVREVGGTESSIEGFTLEYNKDYIIKWYFVKDGAFVVEKKAECELPVILRDTTAPEFDCSSRPDMAVLTNSDQDYADGSTNGTLRGRLKYPTADEYKDNCGDVTVKVQVTGPKSKGGADATTVVANQTALDAHKFYLGTSTIQFIFTDDTQNADTCVQIIKVLEKFVPQPNCKEIDDNISLNVDPTTCKVTIPAANFKIPTARIDYWKEVKFKEVASCPGSDITTLAEFDALGSRSADNKYVIAYPYLLKKVTNVDASGNYTTSSVVTTLEDVESVAKGDTVLAKYVELELADGTVCRTQDFDLTTPTFIKRSEFRTVSEEMRSFGLGIHKLVWVFRNDKGEQDSCSVIVNVKDASAPVIKCPTSPLNLYTGVSSTTCEVEHQLDASLLTVTENCSSPVSYAYTIDGAARVAYTAPITKKLAVGSHVIEWFVKDAAGNETSCQQVVNVFDNTKPSITCPTDVVLDTKSSDVDCAVDFSVDASALTVTDNCTDASDLKIKYYIDDVTKVKEYAGTESIELSVGTHKFYWIVADTKGNSDTCFYNITVVDKTKPVFDCSTIDPVLVYDTIVGSGCEVSYKNIKFKDYYATDNCEGQIKGVLSTTTSLADSVKANDKFVAGRTYNLHWVFADKSGNSVACDQNLIIISNEKPDINCDTINSKKIEKVLDGVCEIAAADLNITAPVAKEHCTGEDIVGVGHRTSGKAMDAPYGVGKDTIIWVFESIYSTEKDSCWQQVHIKDNFAPDIDCDTIQSKKIEKVLDGKCEIAAADLNIETPVAKERCTGADIIGVGHRTSGKAMDAPYGVGKDTIIWVFADPELTTEKDSCWQPIHIKDNFAPDIDCDTIKKVEKILEGECEISFEDLKINTPVAKERCTGADIIGVGYRTSGKALNAPYGVGKDTIIWVFADPELTTEKDSCLQPIDIKSDIEPKFNCDSLKQTPISKVLSGTCVISAADLNVETPFALDACTNDTIWGVGVRRSGKAMDADYEVGRDTIDWTFSSEYSTKVAKCEQYVFIQSDIEPKFNCDSLKQTPINKVLSGTCVISAADLNVETPFALDACTNDTIWGVGVRRSGKAMDADYEVGRDTIDWTFTSEYSTKVAKCEQYVFIQSDIEPKFNCDSLKQTPINKVLSGTCVISAADLNVETPFALDACTNDTIWGVCVRRSGKAMDADYEVGRDTIDWTFSSEYSTKVAKCEQYVFIQSDMEPKFDCDSLKNAPIDTVLHGVCVISAADLKVNTPFALDACTNDTIWGVGARRSGKAMDADYEVGRDTIDWTFSSEYSTKVAKCEQYVFIQSDMEPKFDCDSLKNAPIDTVLHDACVISAADLKVNTPFALDACTNDTIWGVGARRSGKAMDADYEVGRDTIDWKFISEYSTDTALCEQYVYIKSDKPLDFKCDTVTPIKLYPTGCDTILPVASINVPYALDACTKDTIWGKGVRLDKNSADLYTEPYSVGQTHIRWTFISEFSTDTVVCDQLVDVRTLDSLIFACSDITPDTIKVNVEEGKCAVPSTAVTLGSYQAENPCTHDMVDGVAYVGNKKFTEIDSLAIGVTKITWRFVDMSSTLKDSIKECFQYVQVGDINQMPVDCQTFVPINKTLDNGNCTLDFTELGFTPDVVKDLCTDQVIDPVITRYNVILKDSMKYNDPYTVGQDTLYWSYAFRGQEITCPQVVTIFDNYTPDFDCNTLDTIVADAKKGECSVDPSVIALEIPVATDTCNKDLKIPASGVRSDGLSLSDNYPVGRTVVTWTFINMYSDSTVSKVCEQVIDVIGNNKPQIDCDTLKLVEGEAFKGECSVEASRLNIKTPVAVDSCIADLLISGIGTRDDNKGMDEPYAIGETHITWTFVSPYSHDTAYCEQTVIVRDSIEPMFDCSTLDTLRLASTPGECFAPLDSVLAHFVDHYAVDSCTGRQIKGIATMEDGSELQTKYIVGDTALIKWTFIDSTINRVPKICYQAVIVTGDQKPLIDCDSLASHPISIVAHDACELPLTKDSIPTPFALDACTKDTIWGVGERLDGGELYGVYNVGKTYIKWTFTSPFSSKSAECTQYVDLRSDKDIDYNCDDLDTIVVSVDPGVCEKDVKVEVPVGHNPCLTDVEIAGVATRSDNQPLDAPFSIGLTKITWTFTDTTETLVNNVKVCEQIVQVGDINELPVDCDNMPDTLIVLKDECEVGAGVLVLTAPEVIDLCSKEVIKPDTVRKSGLAMTDAYPVGRDTVVWTYKIRNNTYECSQEVNVMTDKKIEFECDSLKPIVDAASADCNVLPENIKIPVPVAVNPCLPDVKIEGVMSRPEASSMDEPFHIGINTIVWTFTDHTGTLTDSVKVCSQIVEIKDTTHLNVDCSILADRSFYLNADNCSMDYAEMKIDSPLVAVTCPDSVLVPVITRASGLALDEKFEVGVDSLFWTYSYKSMYMDTSVTCRQKIEVIDTIKPAVDCSVLADIYYKVAHVNYATAEEIIAQGLRTPKMYDKCMGDSIIGTGVRSDNGDIFKDNYPSGDPIVITWTFTDDHGNADTCMQTIVVEYVGSNDCPNLPDIKAWSDDKNCFVEASALDIKIPSVHDSGLDKDIDGVGYRSDSAAMDANYPVGTTVIDWMFIGFADDTLTCPQNVIVKDTVAPIINCDDLEDITHFLAIDSCVASPATIGIEIPFATDACSSDPIYGIGARSDGREMSEAYEKGTTAITWTFSDVNGNDKTCSQNIIVKDTLAPDFKCETLSNISIIWTQPGDDIPFDFVVNNYGLITDPMVKDSCDGDIYGVPTRSDGAAFNADFKVNTVTKITWIFKDASGNIKECIQDVDITNMPDQDLTCPPLAREVYECAIDTIPQISTTWSSFIAAGGSVSNISYIDTTTFRYEVKDSPDKCHNDIEYWYYVKTLKGKEISCFSSFLVVDNNKPEFVTEVERVIRISCSDTIPAAPEVKAIDLCQGDAEVKLYETTNRSVDRNACEYYSYDIFRRWVAYDGCGNYSDTLLQVIEVRDTLDPYFELPDGWRDTVLATMYKGCRFEIPDLLGKVRAYVRDNCTEMESLDIEQYPVAGTKIEQTTTIDIVLSDFCGNKDTLKMTVLVSPSKAIVHITAPSDVSSCVSDSIALNLSSSKVRSASGSIFVSDGRGGFFSVPSALVWDYYKDYISDSTVIYSSNPTTYYDRFNVNTGNSTADYKRNIAIMDSLLKVNKRIHSGKYIFVAMDTIAYCSDTAEINIDLGEKPRVHFDTGKFDMCEDDELPIDSINNMFNLCVDPMGRSIEKQGWMINGVPYDSSSVSALSDNATLAYYAENSCGVVNSLDSYFTTCTSIETYEDSLEAVGSAANVKKLREDMLKDTSSIFLNVHTRFSPEKMMLTTNPSKPARVWEGEDALLKLETNAEPSYILWYRVQGEFDARFANAYDINANLIDSIAKPDALLDEYLGVTDSAESRFKMFDLYNLQDSALYYAVVADDVCPAMATNVVSIDVTMMIPTAITPYTKDGLNDVFLEKCAVIIFNRYGQRVHEGIGWDGTYGGHLADPGVYFYEAVFPNGKTYKGTVEVVKIK